MSSTQHVSKYLLEVSLSSTFVEYFVGYDENGNEIRRNDVVFSIELGEDADNYVVQGLQPDTPYFIRLTAYNRAGATSQVIGPIWTQKPGYETINTSAWYDIIEDVVRLDWSGTQVSDFTYITYSNYSTLGDTNTVIVYDVTSHKLPLPPGEYLIRIQPCTAMGCGVFHEHRVLVPYTQKRQIYDLTKIIDDAKIPISPHRPPIEDNLHLIEQLAFNYTTYVYAIANDLTGIVDKIQYALSNIQKIYDISDFIDNVNIEIINPPEVITIGINDVCSFIDSTNVTVSPVNKETDIVIFHDLTYEYLTHYKYLKESDHIHFMDTINIPEYVEFLSTDRTKFIGIGKQHEVKMVQLKEYKAPHDSLRKLTNNYMEIKDYINFVHSSTSTQEVKSVNNDTTSAVSDS
jgi:hypothetical protein